MKNKKIWIIGIIVLFSFSSLNVFASEQEQQVSDVQRESSAESVPSGENLKPATEQEQNYEQDPGRSSPDNLYEDKAFESVEKLSVDPATGTATVSIPINVPAGRSGIKPEVNLSYNSSLPNGIAGVGWSLEFGKITRSTKKGVPKYDSTDQFILMQSGSRQELVDISGNSTEFRPELEGAFMKIELINSDYWLVTDKKGIKYYFGRGPSTRTVDPNDATKIFEWHLDKVEDIYGNCMTLLYSKYQNKAYPFEIQYTANTQTNLQPFATVLFETEPRPDTSFSYRSHFFVGMEKRISAIKVFVEGNLQRKYELSYAQSPMTQRSLLTSITQYGDDGVTSLSPTTFIYQEGQKGFDTVTSGWTLPADTRFGEYQAGGRYADLGVRVADANGDGYPDLFKYHAYHGSAPVKKTFLHDGNQSWVESAVDWKFPTALQQFLDTAPEIDRAYGVRMVDVNGDGWVDLVRHFQDDPPNNGGTIYNEAYINNQVDGWVADSSWLLPNDGSLPINWLIGAPVYGYHEYTGNLLDDVNGDGYVDYVKSKKSGWGPHTHMTFINNEPNSDGWTYDSTWNTEDSTYTDFAHGAILVDLNGDSLKDIMYSKDSTTKIYINDGSGWYEDVNSPWKNEFGHTDFNNGTTQCADINGDGMPDLIVSDGTTYKTLLNTGHGWIVDNDWIVPGNLKSYGTKLMDIDADGMLDAVKHFCVGTTKEFYINKGVVPDLLSSMNNGIGGVRSIEYDSACHYDNTFFPFPAQVVKSMTVSDMFGHSYTSEYSYADGLWDSEKRESRGFGYVKVIDPDGNYSETYTLQDDIYKGRPEKQESYDFNNNLLSKTESTWNHDELYPGVNFVYLEKKDNFAYEGSSAGKRTQEQYFYQESPQLGNLTKTINLGEVDIATGADIGSDSRTVEIEYHNNIENGHRLIGLPKQSIVKNHSGTVVRKTWLYYDGATNLNTLPTIGQVTKKQLWGGDGSTDVDSITEYSYDAYGNLLTTTDPNGGVTTITYETDYYIFPLKTENVLNHKITKEYYGVDGVVLDDGLGCHGLWGQSKQIKDPNNQEGKKTYDTFGRLVATVSPLDSIKFPTSSIEYNMFSDYVQIVTHKREKVGEPGTIDSVKYYDGLGRLIQSKSESGYAGTFVVGGQTEYNSRGLPIKKYLPYFSINPVDVIDEIDTSKPYTSINYDVMGRVVEIINSDGSYSTIIYDSWKTTSIDENGHKQSAYADAFGRLIKKEEYSGADGRSTHYPQSVYNLYATTLYTYDSEGNLTQVSDSMGNMTSISYDVLGRKISMDDPDMGFWEYKYDPAGNLVWQRDALNQIIEFEYDELNRLINKTDQADLDVDYYYDQTSGMAQTDALKIDTKSSPIGSGSLKSVATLDGSNSNSASVCPNYGVGRLTRAEYSTEDRTSFAYDILGREVRSTKRLDSVNYQVKRSYDSASRLTKLKYPNQQEIVYTYNNAGQIDGIGSLAAGTSKSLEGFKSTQKESSLKMVDRISLPEKKQSSKFSVAQPLSFAYLFDGSQSSKSTTGTINISVAPTQPLQSIRQNYTIDLSWSDATSGVYKLFVILIESDTGAYLSGAHDFSGYPPGPWVSDNIDITESSGTHVLVKDLEAYSELLGQSINNYIWVAELRKVVGNYDPNNPATFVLVDRMDINTTAAPTPQSSIAMTPSDPYPGVLVSYDFNTQWTDLQTAPGTDYRLYYIILENTTGNYYAAGHDPLVNSPWLGDDVDIPDNVVNGSYSGSKDLVVYSHAGATELTSYLLVSEIRRVIPGMTYDPNDPATYNLVTKAMTASEPYNGFQLGFDINYFRPILNFEKTYEVDFKWLDTIPTFDLANYDYKYYVTLIDADSSGFAAKKSNGQWWEAIGSVTQAAPGSISIVEDLTVVNNNGPVEDTNEFKWIGEIRRYEQGSSTNYVVVAQIKEETTGKDLGLEAYVVDVKYNAFGQIVEIEYGNGNITTYEYDPLSSRLLKILTIDALSQIIQDLNYTYDDIGNILTITDNIHTSTQSFSYDALNRLVQAQGSYGIKTYAYDQVGNILQKDGLTFTYGENWAGPHAVTSLSDGSTFQYDDNGNMIQKTDADGTAWDYVFDVENRLMKVNKNSNVAARFEYDGDGGRVKKTTYSGAAITDELREKDSSIFSLSKYQANNRGVGNPVPNSTAPQVTKYIGSLYEEHSGSSISYIYLGGQRVAQIRNGNVMYYHADHLGGTNLLTDDTGAVKELCEYKPFGGFAAHEKYGMSNETAWFYFTGKEFDEKIGLYYYGARYYNPLIGKFITPDTIVQAASNPQTLNRYSYCGNNPINRIDPTGHSWFSNFFKAIGIAIVGAALTIFSGGALAPLVGAYWAGVAGGALAGATIGGSLAAATAGNVTMGILAGAVGGAVFAGLSPGLSALGDGLARGVTLGGASGPLTQGAAMASNFISGALGGAASGAAVAGTTGADVGKTALMGGVIAGGISLGRDVAFLMRAETARSSNLDPLGRNTSGKSVGFNGDGKKYAGARFNPRNPEAWPAPLGGHQGGQGKVFGFDYSTGSTVDRVFEAYAGPHDWFNGWTYDSVGNLRSLNLAEQCTNTFTNPLNVVIATPIVAASVMPRAAYAAPAIVYGEYNRKD